MFMTKHQRTEFETYFWFLFSYFGTQSLYIPSTQFFAVNEDVLLCGQFPWSPNVIPSSSYHSKLFNICVSTVVFTSEKKTNNTVFVNQHEVLFTSDLRAAVVSQSVRELAMQAEVKLFESQPQQTLVVKTCSDSSTINVRR